MGVALSADTLFLGLLNREEVRTPCFEEARRPGLRGYGSMYQEPSHAIAWSRVSSSPKVAL
jgi:hypothetical protein